MAAALAFAQRAAGRTGANPAVGCLIVKNGHVIARGHTQPSGRPHAEAQALNMAGDAARGADIFVTLEPCAHESERGSACADILAAAQPARVVIATLDPDPRTAGKGAQRLRDAGIKVDTGVMQDTAQYALAGFFCRITQLRPLVTLKLAMSLDGKIAMADGRSKWITSAAARAHTHLVRARHDAILVGGGTYRADSPALDVRLAGLEDRAPRRYVMTSGQAPGEWKAIAAPRDIGSIEANMLMVEGGGEAAAAFLREDLADRLLLYRAPVMIGAGLSIGDIGLAELADAHGRWILRDSRQLGPDRMELYERNREA